MLLVGILLLAIQLFENSMGFMYALLVIDAGFSQIELGLLLAIPGLTGFIFDLFLSKVAMKLNWKYVLQYASLLAILFAGLLYWATVGKSFWLFLLAGMVWYVYYELFCLMQQQYVVQEYVKAQFSKVWGTLYTIMQVGWVAGPIVGALLLSRLNNSAVILHVAFMIVVAIGVQFLPIAKRSQKQIKEANEEQIERPNVSVFSLFRRVLPVAMAYAMLLLITEMFQNFGGLFGESINLGREWSWLIISTFSLALAIGPLFLSRYSINKGKKYTALLLLVLGGAFLFLSNFVTSIYVLLPVLFCAGICVSVALPLEEAVFSDFEKRSPHERASLMMLVRLVASVAYIASPLLGGFIAESYGYKVMFATLGGIVFLLAGTLRIFTPQKIKIPHTIS